MMTMMPTAVPLSAADAQADSVTSSASALGLAQNTGMLVNDFTRTKIPDKHIEKELGAKLLQMSMEERTKGIHELHGVSDDNNSFRETPEGLATKLREISQNAICLPPRNIAAYRKAQMMDQAYVEKIKLLCLRADHYDTEKAATRIAGFFAFKQELFGDDKLTTDITLKDFQGEEREALELGSIQLLQERDRAGRAVILFVGKIAAEYSKEAVLKALYYIFMTALRDEEIQKKGMVFVIYLVGCKKFRSDRPGTLARSLPRLPTRFVAMHICHDSLIMDLAAKLFCHNMTESEHLCRFRGHHGSHLECLYNLMTFGIPKGAWPMFVGSSGDLDLEKHQQWLNAMKVREETVMDVKQPDQDMTSNSAISSGDSTTKPQQQQGDDMFVAVPGPMDIVMGRGRHKQTSIGYLKFRNLLDSQLEEYEAASKNEKRDIVDDIFHQLTAEMGCRFVRETPAGYVKEYNEVAREKVSHTFRNLRLQQREKAKKNASPMGVGSGNFHTNGVWGRENDRLRVFGKDAMYDRVANV